MRATVLVAMVAASLAVVGCGGGGGAPEAPEVPPPSWDVTVTDGTGRETRLSGFVQVVTSHSFADRVDPSEPTRVSTPVDFFDLWCVGPERPYSLRVPFEIVRRVELELRDSDEWNLNPYLLATVTLGDGSEVAGELGGHFSGTGALGETSFRVDWNGYDDTGLRSISFEHEAAAEYRAPGWGDGRVVVHGLDGSTVALEGAALVEPVTNRNDVRVGERPGGELDFETGGAMVRVPWSRIAGVRPKDPAQRFDRPDRLVLTSRDGAETEGHCPPYLHQVQVVRGTVDVGAGYRLWAHVDLGRAGRPVFTRVELE